MHNRPFLRSGDRRGGGGGRRGGGGSGCRSAVGPDGDAAVGGGGGGARDPQGETFGGRAQTRRQVRPRRRRRGRFPAGFRSHRRTGTGANKRIGRSYALGKRKLPPPPLPPPSSSPIVRLHRRDPPTLTSFVPPLPVGDSPLLASSSSLFRDGGHPSPASPPGIFGRCDYESAAAASAADRWASRVGSIAADAQRRRGCAPPPTVPVPVPHGALVGGGGMGTPSGLSLLRGRDDVATISPSPAAVSPSPPAGSIFTVENLTGGGGAGARVPRASPASYTSVGATRAFIEARDWELIRAVGAEFGSSSALDDLAPPLGTCSDGLHCHPPSTAGMGMPITPALLEPRGGLLGGAAETEPPTWRRGAGSRLDFDGVAGTIATIVGATIVRDTYGEDDLMEPDDVEVSGVNGERFEDLREAARLLGRRAAMEGLATFGGSSGASPPDSSGSGGPPDDPPACSPPLPRDTTPHGAIPPPDEACTCDVLAHLSLASSATRELVRRTGAAAPAAALLLGSSSGPVREAAARLACSPRGATPSRSRDGVPRHVVVRVWARVWGDRRARWNRRFVGAAAAAGGTGDPKPGCPFFVVGGFDRGLDDGVPTGCRRGCRPGTRALEGPGRGWGPGRRVGTAGANRERALGEPVEPRPAGSGGIKGRELRNSVM